MQPDNARNGIEQLKTSFLLYLIGGILALVPVIGAVGGILDLVALIFLILGWRALGRSTLAQAPDYKSTGSWLVRAIVIVVVAAVVGTVAITFALISSVISSGIAPSLQNGSSLTPSELAKQFPALSTFLGGLVVFFSGLYLVWIAAWVKMCLSMRRLSAEVSRPRLHTTGDLLIVQGIVGVGSIGAVLFLFGGASGILTQASSGSSTLDALLGPFGELFAGGYWSALGLVTLASSTISVVASYLGYTSLNSFLAEYRGSTPEVPPVPPALSPSARQGTTNYCPRCGQSLEPGGRYCPACGTKL